MAVCVWAPSPARPCDQAVPGAGHPHSASYTPSADDGRPPERAQVADWQGGPCQAQALLLRAGHWWTDGRKGRTGGRKWVVTVNQSRAREEVA